MHGFVKYVTDPEVGAAFELKDTFVRIGVNVDHATSDRGGIQGLRTLHQHCLCFPVIKDVKASKIVRVDGSSPDHTIIDPLTEVRPQILADHYKSGSFDRSVYASFEMVTPGAEDVMPLAFNLRLKDSWDTLLEPETSRAVKNLDLQMLDIYDSVYKPLRICRHQI